MNEQTKIEQTKIEQLEAENQVLRTAIQNARKTVSHVYKMSERGLNPRCNNVNVILSNIATLAYERLFALARAVREEPTTEETSR
jgi:hypothetical protein